MRYEILLGYLKAFNHMDILKTLYVNFKCLPYKQAIKFPIFIGKGTELRNISGRIIFDCPIKTGLFTIGIHYMFNDKRGNRSVFQNYGKIVVKGKVLLHTGTVVLCKKNGEIILGGKNTLGVNGMIVAKRKISIGYNVDISWNVQIIDTDVHYFMNNLKGSISRNTSSIFIGDNVWIANNVSISKGGGVPNNSIVSSNTLVNKDFLDNNSILLAGIPAKIVRKNVTRVFDTFLENKYDAEFVY